MGSLSLTMRVISQAALVLVAASTGAGSTSPEGRTLDLFYGGLLGICSQGGRCPGTERGVITSPNHPKDYPVKRDINYTLETVQGSLIELTFEAFDLEPGRTSGRGGCYDSLRIIDSDNEILGTYCESVNIKPFNSTSNRLTIIFTSDEDITRSGFRASWRRIEIKETSGKLTSPGYPNLPSGDIFERVAALNAPKGSRFQLTFTDIDLDSYRSSCGRFSHYIYLFDGLPNSSEQHNAQFIAFISGGNILTNQDDLNHTSRSNVVSVWFDQYDYSDYNYNDYDFDCDENSFRGFRLDWKIIS